MNTREYRRLYGGLLLWAVVPLPFTYMVLAPFWLLAVAAAITLLVRRDSGPTLASWVQNLLGIVILAVVVAAGGLHVGPLRPLGHLLLLLTAVKAVAVADRRSFLRAMPPLTLVWMVGIASSTHVTLVLYLLASMCVLWWAGMRLLLLGLAEEAGAGELPRHAMPRWRHAAVAGVVTALLAVPVFVAMPRLRSPWIAAGGGSRAVSGFASAVDLGSAGTIQESSEVALVVRKIGRGQLGAGWSRFRASVFDLVGGSEWRARRADAQRPRIRDGVVWLDRTRTVLGGTVELSIELLEPRRYLFLPQGTVAVRTSAPLAVDRTGTVELNSMGEGPVQYRVWVDGGGVVRNDEPTARELEVPAASPALVSLARDIVGERSAPGERATAIESRLQTSYRYSLTSSPPDGADPVEWFLLDGRQGHCEYFAASMVVLLRHLEVPARMVGGYSGGALAPSGQEVLVKQANAHTWVEVWLGRDQGWVAFDPTPFEGVPGLAETGGLRRVRWLWDQLQIFWDRNVLTFGLGEQAGLAQAVMDVLAFVADRARLGHLLALAGAIIVMVAIRPLLRWRLRTRSRRGPAAAAVVKLARRLRAHGTVVPEAATVRWIGGQAAQRWPHAAAAVGQLVGLAEEELYSPVVGTDPPAARRLWSQLRRMTREGG